MPEYKIKFYLFNKSLEAKEFMKKYHSGIDLPFANNLIKSPKEETIILDYEYPYNGGFIGHAISSSIDDF